MHASTTDKFLVLFDWPPDNVAHVSPISNDAIFIIEPVRRHHDFNRF